MRRPAEKVLQCWAGLAAQAARSCPGLPARRPQCPASIAHCASVSPQNPCVCERCEEGYAIAANGDCVQASRCICVGTCMRGGRRAGAAHACITTCALRPSGFSAACWPSKLLCCPGLRAVPVCWHFHGAGIPAQLHRCAALGAGAWTPRTAAAGGEGGQPRCCAALLLLTCTCVPC